MTISAPSETLIIHLSTASARRLHRVAEIARRPIDEVIAEVLDAGLPPLLDAVPDSMRDVLANMEDLDDESLRERLDARLSQNDVEHYDALLDAQGVDGLDESGRASLRELRAKADQRMFEKAYAALLLKWRGQHVPSLADLEAAS